MPSGLLDIDSLGLTNKLLDLDVADYPLFPVVSVDNKIQVSIKDLELLLESVSSDETRMFLNGVAWAGTDLVSVNGHIMTVIQDQTNNSQDSSIMPRTSIKELVNLSKKFKLPSVTIQVDSMYFQCDTEYFTLVGRLIAREFVRYKTIIPVKTSHSMTIVTPVKFKDVKPILNKKNYAVRLETDLNKTSLVIGGTDFKVAVGTSDFNGVVGFNLKYLEFLTNLDTTLRFNNELSPVVATKGNILRLAMPLKV